MKRFFVTERENRIIKQVMSEHGFRNFSKFAREMLLLGEVRVIDFDELRAFRREVRRIGLNINQIAKQVNIDDEVSQAQLNDLLNEVKELNQKANQLLEKEEREAMKGK